MSVFAFNKFVFSSLLFRLSWRVLAVAALVWLLVKLFRVRNFRVLHFVWTTHLIGMLLLPVVFLFAAPSFYIPLLPAAPRTAATGAQFPFWVWLATTIYSVGLAWMLARLAAGLLSVIKLIRDSQIINSPPLNFRLKQIGCGRLKKLPVVLCSRAVKTPITIGYFRPRIILPADWREWSDAKIRSVLAHEIAHIQRADYPLHILVALNCCFFWFHPLAWLVSRRLSLLSEKICDRMAVRFGGDECEYAGHLLELAAARGSAKMAAEHCGLAMARQTQIRQRIEAVLSDEHRRPERANRASMILLALLVGVCWSAAATLCF